jgi:hypothetical protein
VLHCSLLILGSDAPHQLAKMTVIIPLCTPLSERALGAIRRVKSAALAVAVGSNVGAIGCCDGHGPCRSASACANAGRSVSAPSRSRWPIQTAQNPFGSCNLHPSCKRRSRSDLPRALPLRKSPRGVLLLFFAVCPEDQDTQNIPTHSSSVVSTAHQDRAPSKEAEHHPAIVLARLAEQKCRRNRNSGKRLVGLLRRLVRPSHVRRPSRH